MQRPNPITARLVVAFFAAAVLGAILPHLVTDFTAYQFTQAMIYGMSRMLIDGHFPEGRDPEEATAAMRQMLKALVRR